MNKKKSNDGQITGFIFGLIFFLAGVLAVYDSIGKVTLRYISSFSWEQVSASVTTLKLEKSRSKKSMYYRVKAQYSYLSLIHI